MNTFLGTLNIVLVVLLVALGVAVWVTAKLLFTILFLVVLVVLRLNIMGVWGSLFSSKPKANSSTTDSATPIL